MKKSRSFFKGKTLFTELLAVWAVVWILNWNSVKSFICLKTRYVNLYVWIAQCMKKFIWPNGISLTMVRFCLLKFGRLNQIISIQHRAMGLTLRNWIKSVWNIISCCTSCIGVNLMHQYRTKIFDISNLIFAIT